MADSDSVSIVSSSQSGDDDRKRRCSTTDLTSKYYVDKHTPGKQKTSPCCGGPEIGASYLIRRLDDTYRKYSVVQDTCVTGRKMLTASDSYYNCRIVSYFFTHPSVV